MAAPTQQDMQRTHVAKYGYWWKRLPGVPRESAGYEVLMDIHVERYILGNYDRAKNAGAKLARKGCDLLVVNEVGVDKTFGQDENTVHILRRNGQPQVDAGPAGKEDIAQTILDVARTVLG